MQTVQTKEYKKNQKTEKVLSAVLLLVALAVPVTLTYLMEKKVHWIFSACVGFSILMSAWGIVVYRHRLAKKLQAQFQGLNAGYILVRKTPSSQRFVITNTGYNHYYLKSVETGEQLLVSRRRAQEDFDIAL